MLIQHEHARTQRTVSAHATPIEHALVTSIIHRRSGNPVVLTTSIRATHYVAYKYLALYKYSSTTQVTFFRSEISHPHERIGRAEKHNEARRFYWARSRSAEGGKTEQTANAAGRQGVKVQATSAQKRPRGNRRARGGRLLALSTHNSVGRACSRHASLAS